MLKMVGRDGRAVKCDSLENCWGGNSSVGSNPTLSASLLFVYRMKFSHQTKALLSWVKTIWSYFVLIIFLFWCIQPQYFKVDYHAKKSFGAYPVYASVSGDDISSIKLDNLIVWEDGSSKISYTVKEGDTIQSIAQQFGTTTQSIRDSNGIGDKKLLAWKVLYISYDDGVLIYVKETTPLDVFVQKYNLDLEDTMSLNYFDQKTLLLEQDQELFVNLTQKEAEKRGLIDKQLYESPFERLKQDQMDQEAQKIEDFWQDIEEFVGPVQQDIISPEETAQQIADQFRVTREQAGENPVTNNDQPTTVASDWIQKKSCEATMCLFDGNCYYKPQQAYCIKDDPKRMWKCKEWFVQQGNTCVATQKKSQSASVKKQKTIQQERLPQISSQPTKVWYFNPRANWAPTDGWGPWQCTSFAHWYRWKHYGIKSLWFRGNAGKRLTNASRAWWLVNKSPAIGAFGVSNESPVWHVFVVIGIEGNKVLIQEMNYAWRYIVTKRWKSIASIRWFIHPIKTK